MSCRGGPPVTGALLKADMVVLGCDILSVVTHVRFRGREVSVPSANTFLTPWVGTIRYDVLGSAGESRQGI